MGHTQIYACGDHVRPKPGQWSLKQESPEFIPGECQGAMSAGKTSMAICKAHEFKEHGKKVYKFPARKPKCLSIGMRAGLTSFLGLYIIFNCSQRYTSTSTNKFRKCPQRW